MKRISPNELIAFADDCDYQRANEQALIAYFEAEGDLAAAAVHDHHSNACRLAARIYRSEAEILRHHALIPPLAPPFPTCVPRGFALHFVEGLIMDSFTVREIETVVRIAWEGFEVQVWATEEHDAHGNRIWYYRENALNFGRTTSREQAVEVGSRKLQESILAENKPYAPLSEEFLESIKVPFVEEVHTIIKVSCGHHEVRIITVDDPYVPFERRAWKFKDAHLRMGRVHSQQAAVARAKRYLRAMLSNDLTYGFSFAQSAERHIEEGDDDGLPF
jgi:hypothetical protein